MKKIKALLTAALLAIAIPMAGSLTACGKKGEEEIVETTKYTFTANSGDGYDITVVTAGIFLDSSGSVEVDEGTTISFIVSERPGYDASSAVVKANQNILSKNVDSSYSVIVNSDITITVSGVVPF